jgi:hypothetical protein
MKIAFLTIRNRLSASNVDHFIDGLKKYSSHDLIEIHPNQLGFFDFDLNAFDAVCLHYTTIHFPMRIWKPFSQKFRCNLESFKGPKIAFVQDEQRALNDRNIFFNQIKLDHLMSVSPSGNIELLYPTEKRCFNVSSIFTAYVRMDLIKRDLSLTNERNIDLFYRGRRLPQWFDEKSRQKDTICNDLKRYLKNTRVKRNISNSEILRVYGRFWEILLYNSKASILTPSGSGIIDRDGRFLENWVKPDLPKLTNEEPLLIDNFTFSPRIFEYAEWGTLIVSTFKIELPDFVDRQDYILLDSKLLNLKEVIDVIENTNERLKITNSARQKLILSGDYSYEHLAKMLDSVLERFGTNEANTDKESGFKPELIYKTPSKFQNSASVLFGRGVRGLVTITPTLIFNLGVALLNFTRKVRLALYRIE